MRTRSNCDRVKPRACSPPCRPRQLRRLAGPANTLTLDLAPDLGNTHADPAQLQQVILNLVINARDALPATGGVITIRTAGTTLPAEAPPNSSLDLPAGRYVRLSVQDNGAGMDADTLSHLFEPFFTTKDLGKGTGLGLSTVYGIVKQSRGSVTAQSDLRAGSTFSVYLPEVSKPVQMAAKGPWSGHLSATAGKPRKHSGMAVNSSRITSPGSCRPRRNSASPQSATAR